MHVHDQSNLAVSFLIASAHFSVNIRWWWVPLNCVWIHDQSNLFLSPSSAHFIANIRRWVLLNLYVWMRNQSNLFLSSSLAHFIVNIMQEVSFTELCMYGCMTRVTFFSLHHRLTSLPTSVGEFYWIVMCVWMHDQSNFFLSSSSAHFIAIISGWVLLNCDVCMDAWPE